MTDTGIKPETQTLEAFIHRSVERLLSTPATDHRPDELLFLGNWHDAMPRMVFQDPVLQPVDTRVWGVIKIASRGSEPTAFPTYAEIARTANVGSETTVSRAIAILRITRWLSLCQRVRDAKGRYRGNVYALHDEPLPLADAAYLDPQYLAFLNEAGAHAHPRVRGIARAMLASIGEDVREELSPEASPLARRLSARRSVEGLPARYFGFTARQLQKLKSEGNPLQFLRTDRLQKLESDSSCSCIYKKTTTTKTTTTTTPETSNRTEARADITTQAALIFPEALTRNEQYLARMCLRDVDRAKCQDILDELAGRLDEARRRNQPIGNPIGYLARLVKAMNNGTFVLTSLGLNTRQARARTDRNEHSRAAIEERAQAELDALLAEAKTPRVSPSRSGRTRSGKASRGRRYGRTPFRRPWPAGTENPS